MINKLVQILNNNKKIIENFSYLSLLRIFSLLFPLFTYPYLLRVLGFEIYGSVVFAQSISAFSAIIINFGFNISGTKDVACNKDDVFALSKIVSSIYSIKFLLWLGCLFFYFLLVLFVPFLREDKLLYLISFFLTFNELLFPSWFFQGIEKMKYITFINIGVRLLFVISIFLFVKTKSDYLLVPVINSIGGLFGGVISMYVVFFKEKILFIKQSYKTLQEFFYDSLPLFLSSLSTQIYVNANKIFVGSFLGMTEVAIYDLGEKITSIMKIPVGMISQATFPKISREKNISFINKIMLLTTISISLTYIILYFNSNWIVKVLSGSFNTQAVDILRILSFSVIISALNLFLGSNRLVPFGYKKAFVLNAFFNSVFFILGFGFLWLFSFITLYTLSYLYLAAELFVLGLNLHKSFKFKLFFSSKYDVN